MHRRLPQNDAPPARSRSRAPLEHTRSLGARRSDGPSRADRWSAPSRGVGDGGHARRRRRWRTFWKSPRAAVDGSSTSRRVPSSRARGQVPMAWPWQFAAENRVGRLASVVRARRRLSCGDLHDHDAGHCRCSVVVGACRGSFAMAGNRRLCLKTAWPIGMACCRTWVGICATYWTWHVFHLCPVGRLTS